MRLLTITGVTSLLVFLIQSGAPAQTEGTATLVVKTERTLENYDPRHVLAIWVSDTQNHFVKTLKKMAASREEYLYTWRSVSNRNVTDAITGATISSPQTHTVSWNGTDTSGNVVPDGNYRIHVEFTTKHAQGPMMYVEFTKGPDPVDLTRPNSQYFTNVSLSYRPNIETNTLIEKGSMWKYHDKGEDLHDTDWKLAGYDDSLWGEGRGKLGYSDSPVTPLSYGNDADNKYPCYYFRHVFSLSYIPTSLKINLLRDDGAVVYLNGQPAFYSNMDEGPTEYNDLANDTVDSANEGIYFPKLVQDTSSLVLEDNVIAVELHQAALDSSDIGFDLELKASPPTIMPTFIRGDVDGTKTHEITDATRILGYLFLDGAEPDCLSSADTNDDEKVDVSDVVKLLWSMFVLGTPLPPPWPGCGTDPTSLPCKTPLNCEG